MTFFSSEYHWPIIFIIAGVISLIPSIKLLKSEAYAKQLHINLQAIASKDYTNYKRQFPNTYKNYYLWVMLFGPDKTYELAKKVFAPMGIIVGLGLILWATNSLFF